MAVNGVAQKPKVCVILP